MLSNITKARRGMAPENCIPRDEHHPDPAVRRRARKVRRATERSGSDVYRAVVRWFEASDKIKHEGARQAALTALRGNWYGYAGIANEAVFASMDETAAIKAIGRPIARAIHARNFGPGTLEQITAVVTTWLRIANVEDAKRQWERFFPDPRMRRCRS